MSREHEKGMSLIVRTITRLTVGLILLYGMYIIFIIPLWFYVDFTKQNLPLDINWIIAILVSFGLLILFYMISRLIEYINISN